MSRFLVGGRPASRPPPDGVVAARSAIRSSSWSRRLMLGAALLVAGVVGRAETLSAQATPEGTVITNTASASWTDANGNAYTAVTANASVAVGFSAAIDVRSAATVTPASPSALNEATFLIQNPGNGTDSVSVAASAGAGVTITGYKIGATTYATLAALNLALSATPIASAGSVSVTVVYSVASGQGGNTIPLSLTATSLRTPAVSDASTTNVSPPVAGGVSVTPDGAAVTRLPSNGTQYTATFTVTNNSNASDTYNLAGAFPGAIGTVVSVNGTVGSRSTVTIGAGASVTVDVIYTVADVVAGTSGSLRLTATSQLPAAETDAGDYVVTVIRANLTMTKEAYRDDQTTAITGLMTVLPGEYIQYKITVTNAGAAGAVTVAVSDALPAQVTYQSAVGDLAGWTLGEAAGTVSAALSGTLAPAATRFFWVRVRIK